MSIQVALHHKTEYHYDRPVTLMPQVIRLRPAPHCRTPILAYSLKVLPAKQFFNWQQDPYSNYLARIVFLEAAREFVVEVDLVAEMVSINPFDFFIEEYAESYPFRYESNLAVELHPYLEIKESGPLLMDVVREMRRDKLHMNDYLVELNRRVHQEVRYIIRMEPGVQTAEQTLTKHSGSCRDSAWLMVQLLRHLGLAARFVSGYLIQLTADVAALDGPSGTDRDFTDLHAWAEVYLPGAGWIGLDPTSGLLAGEGHIPLACSADPQNAAPISGTYTWNKRPGIDEDEVATDFRFTMTVARVVETPRVTKPYTDGQWAAIDQLGHQIDADLNAQDVRLTMGGEPTFVGIDDRDAAEWNTAAQGPTKRLRADTLLRRLRDRFAPGGLLHFGQGKWYPGESLPRWAYACYWRKDGIPLWTDPHLVAEDGRDYGYGPEDAQAFVTDLARRLAVNPVHAIPGYEDTWYYLWKERKLPTNVDPLKSNLDDAEERARLTRIFEQGLDKIVGYTLPLRRVDSEDGPRWQSGQWCVRREHLFLYPGDSPMGYRLPLDSLPWEPKGDRDEVLEDDPWRDRHPLPTKAELHQRYYLKPAWSTNSASSAHSNGRVQQPARNENLVRTALCVEPRGGRLYVFMPPTPTSEDYIELIAAVEATAKALHMPVMLEGYAPPFDPRLVHFKVTPDPGVIEVNIHPSANWAWSEVEKWDHDAAVRRGARQARLCAEKFMLDGKHTGTGGGNHIVLGGPTPADSPTLRRPDLLRSLVGYWHNHPSLSYLFSGLFLGPTSQAPRIDEARNDSIYELEVASSLVQARVAAEVREWRASSPWLNDVPAVAGRSRLPQLAHRCHRQHAPGRVVHRQALFARFLDRPAGAGRIPRLRDAAARPHEPGAAAPDARPDRPLLEQSLSGKIGTLGHAASRPLHAGAFCPARFPRRAGRAAPRRLSVQGRMVRAAFRISLPALGQDHARRGSSGIAASDRAVARARRGNGVGGNGPLCRFVGRARRGEGARLDRSAPRHHLQRPAHPAAPNRRSRRVRGQRALSRLAAAVVPASDDWHACAARFRSLRHVDAAQPGRLRLPRRASGRPIV